MSSSDITPPRIAALVMAGGRGKRLHPLTAERTKPAVPFGGKYRIIDFVLSSLLHSNIRAIFVLTQYKAQSLLEHLQLGWMHSTGPDKLPDRRTGADAVRRVLVPWNRRRHLPEPAAVGPNQSPPGCGLRRRSHLQDERPSDGRFPPRSEAAATVACLPVPVEEASAFGVIKVDKKWKIIGFVGEAGPTARDSRPAG